MFGALTILSAIVAVLAVVVLWNSRKDLREISKYCTIGMIIAILDFMMEFIGTKLLGWQYNQSIYLIGRLVPIELVVFFFAGGILLRFVFIKVRTLKSPPRLNLLLYSVMLFGVIIYVRDLWLNKEASMLTFSAPFGLWGMLNIREHNRGWATILAIAIACIDFVVETFFVQHVGNYGYRTGFSILTSFTYGFIALGLFGLMEKIDAMKK